jgi:hypothetical protein
MTCCKDFIVRTCVARSRGCRKYFPVGLMTALRAANTSFTSYYVSPTLGKSYSVKNSFILLDGVEQL